MNLFMSYTILPTHSLPLSSAFTLTETYKITNIAPINENFVVRIAIA